MEDEITFARKIETTDDLFKNKKLTVSTIDKDGKEDIISSNTLSDDIVLCNGCNGNIYPEPGWMIYFGIDNLRSNRHYDIYHEECLDRFKDLEKIE